MLIKNNIKKVICNNWKNGECKYIKEKCIFAHGEDDKIKEDCQNGIKCYNQNCWFKHPEGWNAYNNKKECIFCDKGFCDRRNNKYKHINNSKDEIIDNNIDGFKNVIKKIDFDDNDFPKLIKEENIDINIKKNKLDNDDLPILIKDEDGENDFIDINDINTIKKELYKKYKFLSKLNPSESWANEDIVEETNKKIKVLTDKYNILKEKRDDIINEELKLELLENNYNKKDVEDTLTCININNDNHSNTNVSISVNYNDESDNNILSILNKMEEENKKYIIRIKNILDKEKTINDENKLYYKLQLNNFIKETKLLKLNYEDCLY